MNNKTACIALLVVSCVSSLPADEKNVTVLLTDAIATVDRKLEAKSDFEFENLPLTAWAKTLTKDLGLPVVVKRRAIAETGIEADDVLLDLEAEGISYRSAIRMCLRRVDLWFVVGEGYIRAYDA